MALGRRKRPNSRSDAGRLASGDDDVLGGCLGLRYARRSSDEQVREVRAPTSVDGGVPGSPNEPTESDRSSTLGLPPGALKGERGEVDCLFRVSLVNREEPKNCRSVFGVQLVEDRPRVDGLVEPTLGELGDFGGHIMKTFECGFSRQSGRSCPPRSPLANVTW